MGDPFRILTWNMDCMAASTPQAAHERRRKRLVDLMSTEQPDLILLQETADAVEPELRELGFHVTTRERLTTAIRSSGWALHAAAVQPSTEHRFLAATFRSLTGIVIVTWNVHLPSPVRARHEDAVEAVRALVEDATRLRQQVGIDAFEVVGGDFNLPPYDSHIMRSRANFLKAGRSALWAQNREERTGERHFVNAAWLLLGRADEPLATLFVDRDAHTRHTPDDAPWYQYDQVMLSPSMLRGRRLHCDICTTAGTTDLSTKGNVHRRPSRERGSDHYPLLVTIRDPILAQQTPLSMP